MSDVAEVTRTAEVITERHDSIEVLRLHRPDRANALTDSLIAELIAQLDRSATDEGVLGVVLTGSGRAFCAGGDIQMLIRWRAFDAHKRVECYRRNQRLANALLLHPKPVVAAVNGAAAGAGLDLALAADVCLAASSASFRTAFAGVGLVPDFGGSWLLPRIVGFSRARQMLLTGHVLDAETARDWGIVTDVMSDDGLLAAAVAMASGMASSSAAPALAEIKRALVAGSAESFDQALERSAVAQSVLMDTPDHHERTARFVSQSKT